MSAARASTAALALAPAATDEDSTVASCEMGEERKSECVREREREFRRDS